MTLSPAWTDYKDRANQVPLLTAAQRLGASLRKTGAEYVGPCPACGGKDRFSVNPTKNKFNCRGAEGGSTSVGLVMHAGKMSFGEACQFLTGDPPPSGSIKPLSEDEKAEREKRAAESHARQERLRAEQEAYEQSTTEAAFTIWMEAKPILGTLGERYLHLFGLPTPPVGWPACLRFHPSLKYPGAGRMPALLARVDDVAGEMTGIWREYMTPDARKADVEFQKLGLGPVAGGAVRLGGVGPKIGLAEGLRTGLGAWALIGWKYPVWPCLSTSGLVGFEVPLGVKRAIIFADGDVPIKKQGDVYVPVSEPPGRKAARTLRDRLVAESIEACIAAEPRGGADYLDLYVAQAREVA